MFLVMISELIPDCVASQGFVLLFVENCAFIYSFYLVLQISLRLKF